jgi:hypothetical protein
LENKNVYKIDGKTFELKPLVVKQLKMLTELFEDLKIDPKDSNVEIINKIITEQLTRVMGIIFYGQPCDKVDWQEVPYEIIDEVVESFFVLNPRLKMRLTQLFALFTNRLVLDLTPGIKNTGSK